MAGPEIPRLQVHQRLGIQGPHIGIAGELVPNPLHRFRVRAIQGGTVLGGRPPVSLTDGDNQGPLDVRFVVQCRDRFLRRLVREPALFLTHDGVIDVRAAGVGRSPPSHRTGRIDGSRLLKRPNRFVMVVAVQELDPLIKPPLSFGRGACHTPRVPAEAGIESYGALNGGPRFLLVNPVGCVIGQDAKARQREFHRKTTGRHGSSHECLLLQNVGIRCWRVRRGGPAWPQGWSATRRGRQHNPPDKS